MRVIRFPFLSTDIQPVLLASSRHVCQILEVAGWSVSCCCELARHGPGDELFGGPAWSDGLGGGGTIYLVGRAKEPFPLDYSMSAFIDEGRE